jgi:hypothetical protein
LTNHRGLLIIPTQKIYILKGKVRALCTQQCGT